MDVMNTAGAFSWSELLTSDPARAAEFYGSLFGWTIEAMPMPSGTYHVAKLGGTPIAGLMASPDPADKRPPAWSCYVTVADVDATVANCLKLGGTLLMPAMDVPTVGRMACIRDPQGAALNVISYEKPA
ncbi:MAG: VOC family protein [Burkholderiaceae bacterium]